MCFHQPPCNGQTQPGTASGAAWQAATVCVPQVARPEPVSEQVNFVMTLWPTVKVAPDAKVVALNVGAVLSIGVANGPCAFDTLPARSLTVIAGICAVAPVPVVLPVSVLERLPCDTAPFVFATTLPGAKQIPLRD